jgi:Flp pilus assembly pilin Flp
MMGRGFEPALPAARKLLIRKQQENRVPDREVPSELRGQDGVRCPSDSTGGHQMKAKVISLWREDQGQDIAEYAVMLAVILVIVVGTIRLIGSNANNVFSSVASSVQ